MKYDVVVIGAGASGMMAAIQAAKKSTEEGTGGCIRVALLEDRKSTRLNSSHIL